MKRFLFLLAIYFTVSLSAIGQSGWTLVDSGLPVGKGVGQISVGMNDNTAMWGLAINDDGSIYDAFTRSIDGGNTWVAGTFNAGTGLSQLFAIDANTCWAVFNTGATQGLYKTTNGGTTWVKKGGVYGASSFANVIHFFDDMYGVAQGDPVSGEYEIYVTTNGGEAWTPIPGASIPNPTSGEFGITGNYCAFGDNIWFGTNQGRIFRSTDKGNTWAASMTAFGAAEVVGSVMFDAMNGFAYRSYLNIGVEPVLNETSDGGATWTPYNTVGSSFARYFYRVPGTVNTVIGSAMDPTAGMGISISEDGGVTWTEISVGYPFQASAWLDLETGWCGTFTTADKSTGGMYIFGELNFDPPTNLTGPDAVTTGETINLEWDAPGGGGTIEELIYDNDVTTGAYSYSGYTMSTHMSPAGSCKVLKMKFYTTIQAGANDFNATLFEWAGSQPGLDIIYQENVTAVDDNWMEVDISSQNITFNGDFVVGFGSVNAFTFLGYDAGLNNGRSWDFNNSSPSWAEWNEAYLIRAIVEYTDGTIAEIGAINIQNPVSVKSTELSVHPTDYSAVTAVKPIGNLAASVKGLVGYNVYRDGSMIDYTTETFYNDVILVSGIYQYFVTAVYENPAGESLPSNTITVDVLTSIEDVISNSTSIYPNPASEVVNIKSDYTINTIKVYNYSGQVISNELVDTKFYQFNTSQFTPGLYMFQIETNEGTITKRIIIE